MNPGVIEMATEGLRWLSMAFAFACLLLFSLGVTRRWEELTPRLRRIGMAFCLLLAVISYGSWEAASLDLPTGPRVLALSVSLVTLFGALLWRPDESAH